MPSLKDAEFWSDGSRTLYCGDSLELARLLPYQKFRSLITDPPYGEGILESGDENPELAAGLLAGVLKAAKQSLKPAAHVAVFWTSRTVDQAIDAGKQAGLDFKRLLFMYLPQGSARPYRGWLPRVQPIVLFRNPGREFPEWRRESCQAIRLAMKRLGWKCTTLGKKIGVSARLVTKWYGDEDIAWSYPNDEHRQLLKEILGVDLPPQPQEQVDYRHDLYTVRGGKGGTGHPCEKPIKVVEDLVKRLGGPVLDPFCGGGTTLAAAKTCGLEAIGLELDRGYCEMTKLRLNESLTDGQRLGPVKMAG